MADITPTPYGFAIIAHGVFQKFVRRDDVAAEVLAQYVTSDPKAFAIPLHTADALTAQAATIAEQARELAALRAALQEADTCMGHEDYDTEWRDKWAHLWAGKVVTPDTDKCRKCNGNMRPGTYLAQTMTGIPDFPGDRHAVTVSPGGPGWLEPCSKCEACGHSVTDGKAVTP